MKDRETEMRFLVRGQEWAGLGQAEEIVQCYLSEKDNWVLRARIKGESAFLTLKSPTKGMEKLEIEDEISVKIVKEIIQAKLYIKSAISKVRRTISVGELIWEVDQFFDENDGLVLAEVEYKYTEEISDSEWDAKKNAWRQKVLQEKPSWVSDVEVTEDFKYSNSKLAERSFSQWSAEEKAPMQAQGAD